MKRNIWKILFSFSVEYGHILFCHLISFALLSNCLGDIYFDTVNSLDSSKVSRNEAINKVYLTIAVKKSLCPQASDILLLSAGFFTTKQGSGCTGISTTKKSEKTLQSCDSKYNYFEKKDLNVCILEILTYPCEPLTITDSRTNYRLNFPICRGMFGPGGSGPTQI